MPIIQADIDIRLSGGGANADPDASIGGAKSSVDMGAGLHNLFDIVGSTEAAAGNIEYRMVYIHNSNGVNDMITPKIWLSDQPDNANTSVSIGLDPAGLNGTPSAIADEDTAPAGVTFSAPASEGAGLEPVDIGPGEHIPVWVRRTVTAGASAETNDSMTLNIKCDTLA